MQTRSGKRPLEVCVRQEVKRAKACPRVKKEKPKEKNQEKYTTPAPKPVEMGAKVQTTIVDAFSQRKPLTALTGTEMQKAKKALHASAVPCKLHGRESEHSTVRTFWLDCLQKNEAGSLYISGSPGTGKTATVDSIEGELRGMQANGQLGSFKVIKINCMKVIDPKSIYTTILRALSHEAESNQKAANELEEVLCPAEKQPILATLILDEVDQLSTKGQDVLYSLFELPKLRNSRLVLIAIANALDLTERLLPRLQAKSCEPQCLNFNPYTKDQISAILRQRLQFLQNKPPTPSVPTDQLAAPVPLESASSQPITPQFMFDNAAIEMCARKVAAASGDVRKALDMCRRAIEIAEIDQKRKNGGAAGANENAAPLRVMVPHVLAVAKAQSDASVIGKLQELGLHAQFVLATFVASKSKKDFGDITLGKLHDQYATICRQKIKSPVSTSEYFDLCEMLAAKGFIEISPKPQEKRLRRVHLRIDESEVRTAYQDNFMVAPILETVKPPPPNL